MSGKILCHAGYPGTGKNYLAAKMKDHKELASADSLKEDVSILHNIPINYFYDRDLKDTYYEKIKKTPRELLIEHATEMRKKDIHRYINKVIAQIDDEHNFVITDLRFHSELYRLKRLFGNRVEVVWIKREGYKKGIDSIEITEDDCDRVIENI